MTSTPWVLLAFIAVIALFIMATIAALIWLLYRAVKAQDGLTSEDLREVVGAMPVATVLGVATLGVIAAICVSGVAYGLSIGQQGSIQTIQEGGQPPAPEQTTAEKQTAPDEQPESDGQVAQSDQTVSTEPAAQEQQAISEAQTAQINAGTIGVVSNAQGLGILATIASAAVGGIAGVLMQRQP